MLQTGSGTASAAVHGNRALAKKLQDGVRKAVIAEKQWWRFSDTQDLSMRVFHEIYNTKYFRAGADQSEPL